MTTLLTNNALEVLKKRPYLQPDERPEDLWWRVAAFVASAEESHNQEYWLQKFQRMLSSLDFLPNTPTLVHAGTPGVHFHSLSACFVLPVDDSLVGIMETLGKAALVEKSGGGTGFGLSRIRPEGDKIASVPNGALGPVAVLDMYSNALHKLTQGAVRRGAHMAQLHISHPDILKFIQCKANIKSKDNPLANFNISVQIPDTFVHILKADGNWPLINPRTQEMVGEIKARELWDEICMSAWISGDPGVVFIDRVQASAPNPTFGPIESSNPCGEEFLEPYGSCNLGSINLSHFVTDTAVDWDGLRECVGVAVRFLDDVITVNSFPEEVPELRNVNLLTRRIGLGVMGWADMLDQLLIPYDSEEAIKLAARISRFITSCAWVTSKILAEEKGAFPLYEDSNLKIDFPVRNSSVTTIAPTGSISIIGGCSSGIEPHFDLVWTRKALWSQNGNSNGDSHQMEILECPKFIRQELERLELNPDEILGRAFAAPDPLIVLAEVGVRCDHLRTSHEVSPRSHVEMLAAWQSSITNSVSKTINMPQDATPDQISDAYLYSWALQCKAVTVYRDKSKEIQVLDQLKCPQCEGRVVYQDGCKGCISCGWSACDAPTMDPGNSDYLF